MPHAHIRLLETPEELSAVEALQRVIWPGSETDIVPAHMLITAAHNGGLVLGAFADDELVGFVFGFPGLETTPDGPRPKHCSHMAGVHPDHRNSGLGFALKRAQWQMIRHQGLDHITWTYDPLLSRNAQLNIARLGAVCSTYHRSEYGDMRDGLNAGLPSDRFQVDWWINTKRVERRLSKRARPTLKLNHLTRVGIQPHFTLPTGPDDWPRPPGHFPPLEAQLIAAEIPSDFMAMKSADFALARDWRFFSREFFETAFAKGYLVTDFVFDQGESRPRSFYILTDGESTLDPSA
ncbi:MAG: GNAT family N-acetyltransferase [Chloroflexi bacterium]|nr:GNAT family N-acetyltransferase [Chloroflexota bacterium]MBI3339154.1 GNAT family N-acetyltransferase [Chloroflexota bacterium]